MLPHLGVCGVDEGCNDYHNHYKEGDESALIVVAMLHGILCTKHYKRKRKKTKKWQNKDSTQVLT